MYFICYVNAANEICFFGGCNDLVEACRMARHLALEEGNATLCAEDGEVLEEYDSMGRVITA